MLNSIFSFALTATTSPVGGVDTSDVVTTVTEAVTTAPKIEFDPHGFVENLPYMGFGMLGIFIVIGLIIGATYLVNVIFKQRNKTPKN